MPPELSVVIPFKGGPEAFRAIVERWRDAAANGVEVVVGDGSAAHDFREHARLRGPLRHVPADRSPARALNDKINGLRAAVRAASAHNVLICDDDMALRPEGRPAPGSAGAPVTKVRVRPSRLTALETVEVGRSLVSHALRRSGDFGPAFTGDRASLLSALETMDGDVLFDDAELERELQHRFGRLPFHPTWVMTRHPSRPGRWLSQQVRYAYEDFSMIGKTAGFLALATAHVALLALLAWTSWFALLGGQSLLAAGLAVWGRRRSRMQQHYPALVVLAAPVWLLVRTVAVPLGLVTALRGGALFGGTRIPRPGRYRLLGW